MPFGTPVPVLCRTAREAANGKTGSAPEAARRFKPGLRGRLFLGCAVVQAFIAGALYPAVEAAGIPEQSLRSQALALDARLSTLKDEQVRNAQARAFFEGLPAPEDRLNAICQILNSYLVFSIPPAMAAEQIDPLLRSTNATVRARAVGTLVQCAGVTGKPEIISARSNYFLGLLRSPDPAGRSLGLYALGNSAEHRFAQDLSPFLSDASENLRAGAVEAMGRLCRPSDPWMAEIAAATRDPVQQVRINALYALLKVAPGSYDAEADGMLADREPFVRVTALRALIQSKGAGSVPRIAERLGDPDGEVRLEAVRALGEFRAVTHVSRVIPLLSDPDNRVRREAASALGRFRDSGLVPLLRPLQGDLDEGVRTAAGDAIATLLNR